MPAQDVTNANRRLAGAESFTIAPSKYLGHYVAGNLAARHNIHVTLDNSPGNGITATIDLPPTLLTADAVPAPPDEPHAARDVWPPAPTGHAAAPPASLPRPSGPPPAPLPAAPPAGPGGWQPGPVPDNGRPTSLPSPASGSPFGAGPGGPAWPSEPGGGLPRRQPAEPDGGLARRQPAAADELSRRTPSGLVKRTPRVVDTGEMQALGRNPDDDLLASLSRITRNRPPGGDPQQPPTSVGPGRPQAGPPQAPPGQAPPLQAPPRRSPGRAARGPHRRVDRQGRRSGVWPPGSAACPRSTLGAPVRAGPVVLAAPVRPPARVGRPAGVDRAARPAPVTTRRTPG